jgi:hypothetical protein
MKYGIDMCYTVHQCCKELRETEGLPIWGNQILTQMPLPELVLLQSPSDTIDKYFICAYVYHKRSAYNPELF